MRVYDLKLMHDFKIQPNFISKPQTTPNFLKIHKVVNFMRSHHSNQLQQEYYGIKLKIYHPNMIKVEFRTLTKVQKSSKVKHGNLFAES